jgi:hypothetical protein
MIKMKSNVPPGAAEDSTAPYNEKFKVIEVNISQCLSTVEEIEVPEDFDENDEEALKRIVEEQITLPSEVFKKRWGWCVDDFCVCVSL